MQDRDEMEIGATSGKRHDEVLTQTLGRKDGLRVATGASQWDGPIVIDDGVVDKEKAARAEATSENAEITMKKIERHGDVGGER
ncbi:MAG TPA: hypothetical protein VNX21_01980 [Candidatus Thermoplasmatota archaeon]|nr:hypothetical protein [Candidatus Thermoplasmatota archaeon]